MNLDEVPVYLKLFKIINPLKIKAEKWLHNFDFDDTFF